MGRTVDRPVPHARAWSLEDRREMMRTVIAIIASKDALKLVNAPAIAATYGLTRIEVEAEMMKHLSESEGK